MKKSNFWLKRKKHRQILKRLLSDATIVYRITRERKSFSPYKNMLPSSNGKTLYS